MYSPEANMLLNNLASNPNAHGAMTKEDLREVLLTTGGQLMSGGRLYAIHSQHLAVDVYRVSLRLWDHSRQP